MKLIGWKIFYSDKTFDSTQGSWSNAPDDDVQVIMAYYEDGTREIISDGDWYAKNKKIIRGHDPETLKKYPLIEELGHDNPVPKGAKLKLGKEIDTELFDKIYQDAFADEGRGWLIDTETDKLLHEVDHKPDGGVKPRTERNV